MNYQVTPLQPYEFTPTNWQPEPLDMYTLTTDMEAWLNIPQHVRDLVPEELLDTPEGVDCLLVRSVLIEPIPKYTGHRTEVVHMYVPFCILAPYVGPYDWKLKRPIISDEGMQFLGGLFGLSNITNNLQRPSEDEPA